MGDGIIYKEIFAPNTTCCPQNSKTVISILKRKENMMTKTKIFMYQYTKASETNCIQGWKFPRRNKDAIKILKESWKPPDHNFMIRPLFHKFSQHEFIMLISQWWQHLKMKHLSIIKTAHAHVINSNDFLHIFRWYEKKLNELTSILL